MRPIKLELKGFTAFRQEQAIDFDGLDLFAIAGPTGSARSRRHVAFLCSFAAAQPKARSGVYPLVGDVGTPELLIVLLVALLVFGGSKLPDLARGSGRALRIFKEEVGRTDDDESDSARRRTSGR